MKISIPKERKKNEKRVGITPEGTKKLKQLGHSIIIETGAGNGSNFNDSDYISAGAEIVNDLDSVWNQAEILMKVKEPAPEEYPFFRENLIVYSFLHPAGSRELTEAMLKGKIIGVDYDLIQLEDGRLPILEPMSEIAGILSIQCATQYLLSQYGGKGILLDPVVGNTEYTKVVVLGAGISGQSAAKRAYNLGASVTLLDINQDKLNSVKSKFPNMHIRYSSKDTILEAIKHADIIIGAVLIPGAKAPTLITKEMLKECKPSSVFVDISIDQGGISETSKPTSLSEPTFVEENIIHYCVPNMPAMVPVTATKALTTQTLPWLIKIAEKGLENACNTFHAIEKSVVCKNGTLHNSEISKAFGIPSKKLEF